MCLAVPMKVIRLTDGGRGVASLEGTDYDVDLSLTPDVHLDDYVIVHAGFAIEKLDQDEADARLAMFSDMARLFRGQDESP